MEGWLATIDRLVRSARQPSGDYVVLMHPEQRRTWLCDAVRERWRLNHRLERTRRRIERERSEWWHTPVDLSPVEREIAELDAEIATLRNGVSIEQHTKETTP